MFRLLASLLLVAALVIPSPARAARDRLAVVAHAALDRGDLAAAKKAAAELLRRSPESFDGWLVLGIAQLRTDDAVAAARALERARALDPASAIATFNLASAYASLHRYDDAEAMYEAVAALSPKAAPLAHLDAGFSANAAGRPDDAERHLEVALARAPTRDKALQAKADKLLAAIEETRARRAHEARSRAATDASPDDAAPPFHRIAFEAALTGGYDSDVTRSDVVVRNLDSALRAAPGAPFVALQLGLAWRPLGDARNHLSLGYSFAQTAYFDSLLQDFSLQKHQVAVGAAVAASTWFRAEASGSGTLYLNGLATHDDGTGHPAGGFGALVTSIDLGGRVALVEGAGFSTLLGYVHAAIWSLDPAYSYLQGQRDVVFVGQAWSTERVAIALGYDFHREAIGTQTLPASMVDNDPLGPGSLYGIPYAYQSHGGTLSVDLHLPWQLTVGLRAHYEHRFYDPRALLYACDSAGNHCAIDASLNDGNEGGLRDDDLIVVGAAVSRAIGRGFFVLVRDTLGWNRSNIDLTNPDPVHRYDYDNKNYLRNIVEAGVGFSY